MKDPAFLFYTSDFLTGTMFFTDEQVGKYMRLLCAQHQHGHLTDEHMLKICGAKDEMIWSKFEQLDDGKYHNKRLHEEIEKRSKYCKSRRENRLSALKSKKKTKRHMSDTSKSYVRHMENENEDVNAKGFEEWYKEYPKKVGRGAAEKAWKALKLLKADVPEMLETLSWQKDQEQWKDPRFIPNPSTYLNQKRWFDQKPEVKHDSICF